MERRAYRLLSLFAPYLILSTFAYFLASHQISLTKIEIANLSFFLLHVVLITPFFLSFILKFKLEHEDALRLLNNRIHLHVRTTIFASSILFCIFSFTNIFYEYFVKLRSEGGMWSI